MICLHEKATGSGPDNHSYQKPQKSKYFLKLFFSVPTSFEYIAIASLVLITQQNLVTRKSAPKTSESYFQSAEISEHHFNL